MSNRVRGKRGNGFRQVGADAEGAIAGAGQHDDMDPIVAARFIEGAAEIVIHGKRQRIEFFRPVEADRRDMRRPW